MPAFRRHRVDPRPARRRQATSRKRSSTAAAAVSAMVVAAAAAPSVAMAAAAPLAEKAVYAVAHEPACPRSGVAVVAAA